MSTYKVFLRSGNSFEIKTTIDLVKWHESNLRKMEGHKEEQRFWEVSSDLITDTKSIEAILKVIV